jgi:hypothetical protein
MGLFVCDRKGRPHLLCLGCLEVREQRKRERIVKALGHRKEKT